MKNLLAAAGLLSLNLLLTRVQAAPAPQPQLASTSTSSAQTGQYTAGPGEEGSGTNACALIAQTVALNGTSASLKPSQVKSCLQDVPFNKTAVVNFMDYVLNFTQFQSNLAYLKSPPSDYPHPAVDVLGRFQEIRSKAASGGYNGQYAFDTDIYSVVASTRDAHFKVTPVLIGAFSLKRRALVSISSDGNELPKIYFRSDVVNATGNFTPSEITRIDGQDASTLTGGISVLYQDPDAAFNSAFYNPSNAAIFGAGEFASSKLLSFNDTTTYRFANGSTLTLDNSATSNINMTGVTSGSELYKKYIAGAPATSTSVDRQNSGLDLTPILQKRADPTESVSVSKSIAATSATGTATATAVASATAFPAALGLPTPVAISKDLSISGYFMDERPDTAFLYIAQFTGEGPGSSPIFQETLTDFLELCRKQKKTKLVVDVRGNPGGSVFTAYDAFKQIFPKKSLVTKVRQRSHPAQDALGSVLSQLSVISEKDLKVLDGNITKSQEALLAATVSSFNAGNNLQSPDGKAFKSWKDFSPPVKAYNDNFSNYYARLFSNEPLSSVTGAGVIVAGYGSNKNLIAPYFDSNNVTLLTDAQCSSSCAVLSNLLVSQGGVSTITFGGRPNKNKMNFVGGTQGANVQTAPSLVVVAAGASALIDKGSIKASTAQTTLISTLLNDSPLKLLGSLSVNFLDNFLSDSDIPLQFRQRPADCRAFYIADDIVSMRKTWARVSSGNVACVDGGAKPGSQKKASSATSSMTTNPLWLLCAFAMSALILLQ